MGNSREKFEHAWRIRHPLHGEEVFKRSGIHPEDYCNTRTRDAWWAWQDALDSVVVQLPSIPAEDYCPLSKVAYREECREALEYQGVKVKP